MSEKLEFEELLFKYVDFYEQEQKDVVKEDKDRLENSPDIISDFIEMFNESMSLRQDSRFFWLIIRYGAPNNFKLLLEWLNHELATNKSVEKQDNLGQSQENIIYFLFEKGALKIQHIQEMITVLQRREISGFSDRPRKLLEFHLKRIQTDEIIDIDTSEEESEIKEKVEEAFRFMLKTDPRTNEQILSVLDYEKLIAWVTFYFTNDFSIPKILKPIKSVNTPKGNVIYTFLLFFKIEYPGHRRPDSLFDLIKACFYPYRDDNAVNMRKTSKPQYYGTINKYGKNQ
ncbi:hypothetical protein [Cyclobacterium jeungdonense]|uniref:Uncharacterized protein n=1 Tax=Cyclobacterium jeungdonense TaxID=708087 RepID=A0ABT8C633_9BACT|nr:hypothetical protein [Cyclobacterium jeungdonense]MDN3687243.1 hypothetical protein [Cyclobacterium jeungdonense]